MAADGELADDGTDSRAPTGDGTDGVTDGENTGPEERAVEGDVATLLPSLRERPLAILVGAFAVVLGAAAAFGVGAVPAVDPGGGVVTVLALLAMVAGLGLLGLRFRGETDQAETGTPEVRESVTVPGADFDAELRTAIRGTVSDRLPARQRVVERLRETATAVVAHAERITPAAARASIDAGEWADDAAAAGFLATGGASVSSAVDYVRSLAGRHPTLVDRTDAVLDALAARTPGMERTGDRDLVAADRITDTRLADRVPVDRRTGRWRGLVGLAFLTLGFALFPGPFGRSPGLLVATAVLAGVGGYVYLSGPPDVSLSLERDLSTTTVDPGDRVRVSVTVRNTGDTMIPDLRLVDGVPAALPVLDGSPRYATALRAGQSVSFSYVVEARRGRHAFDPMHVVARDFSGELERERYVTSADPTAVECGLELSADADVPVHPHTARTVGRVLTDSGGSGVELHSVREYRRGDPLGRIDWNRVASTGEFATLQFREEQAATVVVLVDARAEAYIAPGVDAPTAIEHERTAADVVVSSLIGAGDSVGLAALSPEWCWLEPRGGTGQLARARRLLETHAAFDGTRPEGGFHGAIEERRLRRELPGDAQVLLLSPLGDDDAVAIARGLHARGYPVTVVSPDVMGTETTGQRLVAVERGIRISRLRRAGVRVVDWDTNVPLERALEATQRRWSA